MALATGTRLGSYEVLSQIGAGGMGEVYQAHDTKLGRDVAIKVLPEAFAHDPQRLARFQREAKMLAQLNHTNIATIYGLEHSDGTHYLVMELVPGYTLQQRVKRDGPVPVEEALTIAKQIAEALEAAHEKGIIHRDLKPANVKVTPEGKVKVLDFGLAKAFEGDSTNEDMSNSPTLSRAATMQGVILGTAAYMSPEQARGKSVDKRTDIWAFGCVLYELLTGKAAFHGEDVTDILAAVVRAEPDWTALPANISPSIRVLLQRCLRKDRRQRTPDAAAIRIEIEDAIAAPKYAAATPVASASRGKLSWVVAAMFAAVAAGALFIAYRATRQVEHPLMRFTDDVGGEIALDSAVGPAVAISLDGLRLAYVSRGTGGTNRISVRLLENPKPTILAGTEGAAGPFFSPDGRWIGFFANDALKKISVDGGAAFTVCDTGANPRMGSWGEDGNIYFANQQTPVMRVPASGGTPSPATQLDIQKGEVSNRGAQLLPGGGAFLFQASGDNNVWDNATILAQSIKTGQRKTLVQGGYFGHYVHGSDPAAGQLVYMHGSTLFAAPMELRRLELTGPAMPVLEDVSSRKANGTAQIGFTASGTLVYITGSDTALQSLAWLDAAGNIQVLPTTPATSYGYPRISPDGTRIVMHAVDASGDNLWVYEWGQNRMTRFTFFKTIRTFPPVWAPDSKHVAFALASSELSGPGIYWIRSDGAGEPQLLLSGQNLLPSSFSPDGKRLAYDELGPDYGIWTVPLDLADPEHPKTGKPELFLGSKSALQSAAFSPDGRWIAYSSSGSGRLEIFVRPFPGPGGQWQVSSEGGRLPVWSRDGRDLFFQGGKDSIELMVASYTARGDSFAASQAHPWSPKALQALLLSGYGFDIAPDGKRSVVVMPAPGAVAADRPTHVTFLLNFADELRRRTATQAK
jgi:Tol biopolymer transport system component